MNRQGPAATILAALDRLLWDGVTPPRTRWAFLVAVLAHKALLLSKALHRLAKRIAPGGDA